MYVLEFINFNIRIKVKLNAKIIINVMRMDESLKIIIYKIKFNHYKNKIIGKNA